MARREVIRRTLQKTTPKGMVDMYTSPREKDAKIVKSILRKHGIKYVSREESREHGWRYCIYTSAKSQDSVAKMLDKELSERNM
jgi:hypothetical protein